MRREFISGLDWINRAGSFVPPVWGDGDDVLWAMGEPLIIAGPPGVGKTTLCQQLALAMCGAAHSDVLGFMVTPEPDRKVAYLACDRPRQAARSVARMVNDSLGREMVRDRMTVWEGQLPVQPLDDPAALAGWLSSRGVGAVFIDSLKDVFGDMSDGRVGALANIAIQHVIAANIEVCCLHHPRKAQEGNRRPRKLDDLHGSTWVAAGAGSVVYLYGEAGDPVVELFHLKQPADVVGPLKIVHDHRAGRSRIAQQITVMHALEHAGTDGITVKDAAALLYDARDPDRNQRERARRKLAAEVDNGRAEKLTGASPKSEIRYLLAAELREPREADVKQSQSFTASHSDTEPSDHAHVTAITRDMSPPLKGGREVDREAQVALPVAVEEQR